MYRSFARSGSDYLEEWIRWTPQRRSMLTNPGRENQEDRRDRNLPLVSRDLGGAEQVGGVATTRIELIPKEAEAKKLVTNRVV